MPQSAAIKTLSGMALAGAILVSLVAPASAQGQGGMSYATMAKLRDVCQADVGRLCAGVEPGGGKVAACLQNNADKLSADCKSGLQAAGVPKPNRAAPGSN